MNIDDPKTPGAAPDGRELVSTELACAGARALIPEHLDGELSGPLGAELRAHLLACTDCRATLRDESNLRRWFAEGAPESVPVPPDFAARVARRALQGDPGRNAEPYEDPSVAGAWADSSEASRRPGRQRGRLLSFLLVTTTAAAAALFAFAVLLQQETLPKGDVLRAEDYVPPWERAAELPEPAELPEAPAGPDDEAASGDVSAETARD